ncbi:hypothetical protein [Endozoicomonas sp.]|uniref:hypothetical protein n=1 Tax=Endozoicomonas sp. TaxID=1892382 RepID=UPI0028841D9F|nr:hypothetical protein [Endozoicomonas sp.]
MMFKLITIIVLSVLLSACMAGSLTSKNISASKGGHRKYAGGWQVLRPNQAVLEMAKFAAKDFQQDSVVKVTDARVQNILGTCYMLAFQMSSGQNWQAELYRDLYGKLTLLELLER